MPQGGREEKKEEEFDMALLEELKDLGVDVDSGLNRLNGNEALFVKLLGTFVRTMESYNVSLDFDGSDSEEVASVTEKAHAIKGAAGNLSITPIYEAYTQIVDLLRAGDIEPAKEEIEKILPVQKNIIDCIKANM